MSSRPVTPTPEAHGSAQAHGDPSHHSRPVTSHSRPTSYIGPGMGVSSGVEHGQATPTHDPALSESAIHGDDIELTHRGDLTIADGGGGAPELQRTDSQLSQSQTYAPSRTGTLKKKASLRKTGSLKRSSSRKSSHAGSVRSVQLGEKEKYGNSEEMKSAFWTPVPTSAHPTDLLADRFQAWRKVLKDLIAYFRDLQKSYEARSKTLHSVSNVINNTIMPSNILTTGGLGDATHILRDFHQKALTESNKSRDMENEVIMQLTGLRSDLQQKIKEIKSLSGDFKNSVDREMEGTKKAVRQLQETLGLVDSDPGATAGRGDPFLVKMTVDRQIARQIEEENYLHRAYLNLESSGRELESIVVGEIQKAFSAYAGILKREAEESSETAERLREGPLAMAKDHEWDSFIKSNNQMVDPKLPLRSVDHITYPGKDHPAAIEVRSGMLERKSKYLKNYTPGWYILSPTHLHEFKSADRISSQAPIMSLYLSEQKLGSRSEPSSSSHKFMLKGRQTGGMHRGHAWVFRAESHDTMMAWFSDIKELTEKTGEDRNAFVRRTHARSLSGNSLKARSIGGSSDGGLEEDEADRVPYSSEHSIRGSTANAADAALAVETGAAAYDYGLGDEDHEAGRRPPQLRPEPGGRFPSEVNVTRGLQAPQSPSSEESSHGDRDTFAAAGALPGSGIPFTEPGQAVPRSSGHEQPAKEQPMYQSSAHEDPGHRQSGTDQAEAAASAAQYQDYPPHGGFGGQPQSNQTIHEGDWMAPAAAGVSGAALGAGAMHHRNQQSQRSNHLQHSQPEAETHEMEATSPVQALGTSSAPIPRVAAISGGPTATNSSSSQGDTHSLSTVPTSVDARAPPVAPTYFAQATVPHTAPDEVPDLAGGVRPAMHSAKSAKTVSDLHIPGEFPKTAAI